MKKILILCISLITFNNHIFCAEIVNLGTGNVNGIYYPVGNAICKSTNKYPKNTNTRCSTTPSTGTYQNLIALKNNKIDLAIVQNDIAYNSFNGIDNYKDIKNSNLRAVMAIYPELLTLVVRKDSKIKTLQDIKGKKIYIGNPNTDAGMYKIINELFDLSDGELSKEQLVPMTEEIKVLQAPDMLASNKIDGYFNFVGHPNNNIADAANLTNIDLVNLNPKNSKAIANLLKKYPFYSLGTIASGTYKGVDKNTISYGIKAILVANSSTSDAAIRNILLSILNNFEDFKKTHPALSHITKKNLLEGLNLPLHATAKQIYKEQGLLK